MRRWTWVAALALLGNVACSSPAPLATAPGGPYFQLATVNEPLVLEPSEVVDGVARYQGQGPLGAAGATMTVEVPLPEELAAGYRLAQAFSGMRLVITGPNLVSPVFVEVRVKPPCRVASIAISGLPPGECVVRVENLGLAANFPPMEFRGTLQLGGTVTATPTSIGIAPGQVPPPSTPRPTPVAPTPTPTPFVAPPPPAPVGGGGGGGGGSVAAPTPTPPGDLDVELVVEEAPATPAPLPADPAFPELPATGV